MRRLQLLTFALFIPVALFVMAACASAQADIDDRGVAAHKQANTMQLQLAMRVLWEDHINYTRNYIIEALADLPGAPSVAERLLRNQDDIGDAIKQYYGDAACEQLSELLREHIVIATQVIAAAKGNDAAALADAQAAWSANAAEIAAFLAGANPNWDEQDLVDGLQVHLDLTTAEVTSRLAGDWEADIASADANHAHMLMLADMLTFGIAAQFPKEFK